MVTTVTDTDFLTPSQVAGLLKISLSTVLRRFANEPGVVDLARGEKLKPGQRPYRVLRIPKTTLSRFLQDHQV